MKIQTNNGAMPRIYLAPMAGVTDWAYRSICRQFAPIVTVTEMVSSKGLVFKDAKTAQLMRADKSAAIGSSGVVGCAPAFGVQIFGSEPETMARAAVLALEQSGADFLDINMGCPTPKIVRNGDGCALMQNPALCGEIVAAVVAAVNVPVTVKIRRGWDKGSLNAAEVAKICEAAGAAAVAVHGRTRAQQYSGRADWDSIAEVKAAVKIPVIANGDICSGEAALSVLRRTKADAVMIGRAALGNPFIFSEIQAALDGREPPAAPDIRERAHWAGEQFRLMCEDKGERVAVLESRKHFCWYLHGLPHSQRYKAEIVSMRTATDVKLMLERWYSDRGFSTTR